jgi:hypothetical protein
MRTRKSCREACGLDPETDVKVLVMAWKLKSAQKPGEIAKQEFQDGMTAMGIDSLPKLKALVPSVRHLCLSVLWQAFSVLHFLCVDCSLTSLFKIMRLGFSDFMRCRFIPCLHNETCSLIQVSWKTKSSQSFTVSASNSTERMPRKKRWRRKLQLR